MGQQVHEAAIAAHVRSCAPADWRFQAISVASVRTANGATTRLPMRLVLSLPFPAAAAVGRLAYGRSDLVHLFDLRCPPATGTTIITIHDLPPLRFSDEGTLPRFALRSARGATAIISPSEFAANEVQDFIGARDVQVIPNGVSEIFCQDCSGDADPAAMVGSRDFVLHAGGATDRKNLRGLAAAWESVARSHPGVTLAMCGPASPRRDQLFRGVAHTRYLGHLDQSTVAALMRCARAVVVPSLYEGFGLPALEGMACGAPVVAANTGALPEVCGDAALLVAPTPDGIAEGLLAVLGDDSLARRYGSAGPPRASQYSWDRAAQSIVKLYERVS
jgi:glycosyltransferase involved in cell wall biosynthesis